MKGGLCGVSADVRCLSRSFVIHDFEIRICALKVPCQILCNKFEDVSEFEGHASVNQNCFGKLERASIYASPSLPRKRTRPSFQNQIPLRYYTAFRLYLDVRRIYVESCSSVTKGILTRVKLLLRKRYRLKPFTK